MAFSFQSYFQFSNPYPLRVCVTTTFVHLVLIWLFLFGCFLLFHFFFSVLWVASNLIFSLMTFTSAQCSALSIVQELLPIWTNSFFVSQLTLNCVHSNSCYGRWFIAHTFKCLSFCLTLSKIFPFENSRISFFPLKLHLNPPTHSK